MDGDLFDQTVLDSLAAAARQSAKKVELRLHGPTTAGDFAERLAEAARAISEGTGGAIAASPGDGVKEQVAPARLGLVPAGDRSYRLTALVQLDRVPGHAGDATLEQVPTIDALPELVAQTSYTATMARALQRMAGLAAAVGGVRRATYGDAGQLHPLVRSLLDGAS